MTEAIWSDTLTAMTRFARHISRLFASIFAIFAILIMFGVWQLSSVTLSSQNWTPYIERVMEQVVPNSKAVIESSSLDWDHRELTISLLCNNLKFLDGRKNTVIFFPKASIKLNAWSLLRGYFIPEEFSADEAQFRLMRHKDKQMTLGFVKPEAVVSEPSASITSKDLLDVHDFVQNIADELVQPHVNHTIQIKNLEVKLYDEKVRKIWQLKIPELNLNHKGQQATGTARVVLKDGDKETSAVQLTYIYERKAKLHNIGVTFQDIRLSSFSLFAPDFKYLQMIDLPVSGSFGVRTDNNLKVSKAFIKLQGAKGQIIAPDMWEKNAPVEKAAFSANYDADKGKLNVDHALIDFGGPTLKAELDANIPTEFQHLWFHRRKENKRFKFTLSLADVPMSKFSMIWPKIAVPNARSWIIENLTGGDFKSAKVTLIGELDPSHLDDFKLISGNGELYATNGRVRYLKGMPAVDDVDARAVFDLTHMDVTIEKGHTGDIKIKPFTLRMSGFDAETQYISIPVHVFGSVSDVLTLIDAPPLGYASMMGLVPSENTGMVDGVVTLSMPMLSDLLMKDVDVKATAKISNFASAKMVPRIALTNGNLDLDLTVKGLALDGSVDLNAVSSKINWQTVFDETKAKKEGKPIHTAIVNVSPGADDWNHLYGIGKYLRTKGAVPTILTYKNMRDGVSTVTVKSDLTKADVYIDQLAFHKPAGKNAKVSFGIDLIKGKDTLFKDIEVSGRKINVKGNATIDESTSALTKVYMNPFIIGRNNAKVIYNTPVNFAEKKRVKVTGLSFDVSGLETSEATTEAGAIVSKDKGLNHTDGQPQDLNIKVKTLYTSKDGYFTNYDLNAHRSSKGWEQFVLSGLAQGKVGVKAELAPNEVGGKRLTASTDDLGVALKGFGAGDEVKGGRLNIFAQSPATDPYVIAGKLKISSFVIKDWPFLARLFNALSPFGFVDLITGNSSFDYMRGDFVWSGRNIEIKDMNAAGSVIGLNIKGNINTETNTLAVHGTAVPFSFVNSIIGSIPLLGDVITGGKGQGVIAAAFDVTGPFSEPDISVNPASLLTPGFLRNIFFPSGSEKSDRLKSIEKDKRPYPKKVVE